MIATRYQLAPVLFTEEYRPDLLGGMTAIYGKGCAVDEFYREAGPTNGK